MNEILAPIVKIGREENLTLNEMGLIDTFVKIYLMALSGEKDLETQEEFIQLMEDNVDRVINIAMSFKYIKYPDTEMDRKEFISYTTGVIIGKFRIDALETVMDLMEDQV